MRVEVVFVVMLLYSILCAYAGWYAGTRVSKEAVKPRVLQSKSPVVKDSSDPVSPKDQRLAKRLEGN